MTQERRSPPNPALAARKSGNYVFELDDVVNELARKRAATMAGRYSSDFRGRFAPPSPGGGSELGLAKLVKGTPSAEGVAFGGIVGIPTQQVGSVAVLQQLVGASPLLADGIMAGAGTLLHLVFRTSFTFGLGLAQALPFLADLSEMGLKATGVIKTPGAALQGRQQQQAMGNGNKPQPERNLGVNKNARAAIDAWKQRLARSKSA